MFFLMNKLFFIAVVIVILTVSLFYISKGIYGWNHITFSNKHFRRHLSVNDPATPLLRNIAYTKQEGQFCSDDWDCVQPLVCVRPATISPLSDAGIINALIPRLSGFVSKSLTSFFQGKLCTRFKPMDDLALSLAAPHYESQTFFKAQQQASNSMNKRYHELEEHILAKAAQLLEHQDMMIDNPSSLNRHQKDTPQLNVLTEALNMYTNNNIQEKYNNQEQEEEQSNGYNNGIQNAQTKTLPIQCLNPYEMLNVGKSTVMSVEGPHNELFTSQYFKKFHVYETRYGRQVPGSFTFLCDQPGIFTLDFRILPVGIHAVKSTVCQSTLICTFPELPTYKSGTLSDLPPPSINSKNIKSFVHLAEQHVPVPSTTTTTTMQPTGSLSARRRQVGEEQKNDNNEQQNIEPFIKESNTIQPEEESLRCLKFQSRVKVGRSISIPLENSVFRREIRYKKRNVTTNTYKELPTRIRIKHLAFNQFFFNGTENIQNEDSLKHEDVFEIGSGPILTYRCNKKERVTLGIAAALLSKQDDVNVVVCPVTLDCYDNEPPIITCRSPVPILVGNDGNLLEATYEVQGNGTVMPRSFSNTLTSFFMVSDRDNDPVTIQMKDSGSQTIVEKIQVQCTALPDVITKQIEISAVDMYHLSSATCNVIFVCRGNIPTPTPIINNTTNYVQPTTLNETNF